MLIALMDAFGDIIEGVVLSMGATRFRFICPDWPDTVEIHMEGGKFVTEERRPVEVVFLGLDDHHVAVIPMANSFVAGGSS